MGRSFNTGRFPNGEAPSILSVRYTTGQTFKKGALLLYTAAGTVSECGADPTSVAGVALQDAGSEPGAGAANSPTVITGYSQEISMAVADRSTVFTCRAINGGTDPVTPTVTMIQEAYGVAKVGTDWVLDIAEVTVLVCMIVDIDIDAKLFLVKFREAVLALP